jgi:ATP-dependent helicase HrpB
VIPLPIDPFIERIWAALQRERAVVVTAQPGAGKTTRLPPALLGAGPAIVLQPRRIAARTVAGRICAERGWTLGREAGYQVRFERRYSPDTKLLVVTEGILTARLQSDPLLSDFSTIVIDEFHERSVHADLAIALSRQAWRARDDLRIVVMSATLDVGPVSAFLGGCPVFEVPGRTFPLDVSYAPGLAPDVAAAELAASCGGDVLCFMPGAAEIRRAVDAIAARTGDRGLDVLALHGGLDADEQARVLALAPAGRSRVIVATNIAETSITIPGITAVVDAGLQKVARYDAARGIDSLVTERISQDAADQRAGRAGRVSSGRVVRLWNARDRLRRHREADIHRIDLSAVALDIFAWGGHPRDLEWYEPPPPDAVSSALRLLERLGAVRDRALTEVGRLMHQLPVHPRLARLLIDARGAWPAVQACALLSERLYLAPRTQTTSADLLSALDTWDSVPVHVKQVARDIDRQVAAVFGDAHRRRRLADADFRRAILAAYPDRVGRRREPGSARVKLSSGTGAVVGRESGVTDGEFLVGLDVRAATALSSPHSRHSRAPEGTGESIIRIAARLEPEWLQPNSEEVRHWYDDASGQVRASRIGHYDAIVLTETPVPVDTEKAAPLLMKAWLSRGPDQQDERLLRRLRFAGYNDIDVPALVAVAARGRRALSDVHLAFAVAPDVQRALDRGAPDCLSVPSGRSVPLEYTSDGGVTAALKLQELFGLGETPRLGPRRVPVLLALLAPNGRPVQMTRDLASFWARTYPDVRRELRGRYPKHPWPEDPWTAIPTTGTTKRLAGDQTTPPGKKTR